MLSSEQFSEIIALVETTSDDGPKSEVRRAQRVAHPCRISITMGNHADSGPAHVVELKDISARGMCFLHNQELKHNSVFVVTLEAPAGEHVTILCNVVHCREIDKSTYQVGAEFTCALDRPPVQTHQETGEDLMRIHTPILH